MLSVLAIILTAICTYVVQATKKPSKEMSPSTWSANSALGAPVSHVLWEVRHSGAGCERATTDRGRLCLWTLSLCCFVLSPVLRSSLVNCLAIRPS